MMHPTTKHHAQHQTCYKLSPKNDNLRHKKKPPRVRLLHFGLCLAMVLLALHLDSLQMRGLPGRDLVPASSIIEEAGQQPPNRRLYNTTSFAKLDKGTFQQSTTAATASSQQLEGGDNCNDDVLYLDKGALRNVEATYSNARSWIEPFGNDNSTSPFTTIPIMATVDSSLTQRRIQKRNHPNATTYGCVFMASTYVSNFNKVDYKSTNQASCSICVDIPDGQEKDDSIFFRSKCILGQASVMKLENAMRWQVTAFPENGYPWTVMCHLPNDVPELTCQKLSELQERKKVTAKTTLSLATWNPNRRTVPVHSEWQWTALEEGGNIKPALDIGPMETAVPANAKEVRLAMVEGPHYDRKQLGLETGNFTALGAARTDAVALAKLYHLIRNSPGLTYIIGTVEVGDYNVLYESYRVLLEKPLRQLYPPKFFDHLMRILATDKEEHKGSTVEAAVQTSCTNSRVRKAGSIPEDITLMEALRIRRIQLRIVPIAVPPLVVDKTVCAAQYAFAPYIASRLAPEFHLVIYMDDDAVLVERSGDMYATPALTLQEVIFAQFFSNDGNIPHCPSFRFPIVENYVPPDLQDQVLDCIEDIWWNEERKTEMLAECKDLDFGHTVGRSDSVISYSVHRGDASPLLPPGVSAGWQCLATDCSKLWKGVLMELHLRNRLRKPECTCRPVPSYKTSTA